MNQETQGKILIVSSLGWVGVAATLLTGFTVYFETPGIPSGRYGFPLSWRYWVEISIIQYSWFAFVVDVLFYMAVGYALLLILRRIPRSSSSPSKGKS